MILPYVENADVQGQKILFWRIMINWWFTSPPLDPIEPRRNLAGGEQMPPPPLPDDCLLRPPGLFTQRVDLQEVDDLDSPAGREGGGGGLCNRVVPQRVRQTVGRHCDCLNRPIRSLHLNLDVLSDGVKDCLL